MLMLPIYKYSWVVLEGNGRNKRWELEASLSVLFGTDYWKAGVMLPTELWGVAKLKFTSVNTL